MNKYVKVMFGNRGVDFLYKIGEVNISSKWDPTAKSGKDFGGFNYATEDTIIRWLHRGDTIYDVIIPDDAISIEVTSATKIYRTNKIILENPRKVTDEMALEFYRKSNIPEVAYYRALGAVTVMGYRKTALAILKDKVNMDNIDAVMEDFSSFIWHDGKNDREDKSALVSEIKDKLNILYNSKHGESI